MSSHCHPERLKRGNNHGGVRMNDTMFVETLIISSSFLSIAVILIASVIFLEKYR